MIISYCALRCKEVINIADGKRLGYVSDLELETESGRILSVSVPGPCRFFGLIGSPNVYRIPWPCIRKIGDDLILVEVCCDEICHQKEKRGLFH